MGHRGGKVHICPAREAIREVPHALSVADEHHLKGPSAVLLLHVCCSCLCSWLVLGFVRCGRPDAERRVGFWLLCKHLHFAACYTNSSHCVAWSPKEGSRG